MTTILNMQEDIINTGEQQTPEIIPKTFNDIQISTKTIIGVSNLTLNIEELFKQLSVSTYIQVPKKRGRKKKESPPDPNINLEEGSIITLKYMDEVRGVDLKKKKKSRSQKKFFRNALTIVMKIDNKLLNFKVSKNGKFQITGSKKDEHAEKCIKYIWRNMNAINNDDNKIFKINGENLEIIFVTVMTNIDFNLGFLVNRENLDTYINMHTNHNSLLETSFGYTGVNIKIPFDDDININLKKISLVNDEWVESIVNYKDYINMLDIKDQEKETKKSRYMTFLVFQSGNVIMSGMINTYMEKYYYNFFKIINKCRDNIVEKLES